jgi:DNA-binding NarL/FixJ family response regulator/uncharacterized protein involved in exopolysaccharide biosynthesis
MIRIILVDDQRTVRESLKASLKSMTDLEVVGTAGNGQDAIALVRKLHPDVVLVDMEMPGLDGIATTLMICEQFAQVRVIILSMHDEDHYVAQAVRAGAMGYLIKNTPPQELVEAIRSVHRGYAQIGPGLLNKIITINAKPVVSDSVEHEVVENVAAKEKKRNSGLKWFDTAASKPLGQKKLLYLGIWLLGNACLWGGSLLYLKLVSPVYSSNWTIALPGTASSTSVNLPDIGQASSENQSPFSNLTSDPRENYKLLAESEDVVDAAAQSLKMPPQEFGEPLVKILDNSTLMQLSIDGKTPQESKTKAIALHQSLKNRLAQLKKIESTEPDENTLKTLKNAEIRLEKTRKKLADYQEFSGLNSNVQLENLANSIEQMRVEKAQLSTQQQRDQGKLERLLQELKLTPEQAQDALALHSDRLFKQYLDNYSQIQTELVNLSAKFLASHPILKAKQEDLRVAEAALLQRASSVLGRTVELDTLSQLELSGNDNQSTSQKENILGALIDLQGEQQGLQKQAEELERQMAQLKIRQKQRSRSGSELDRLKKNVQIAEAVYSSTLTQLEINQTDTSNLYPPISLLTQPNLPKASISPKKSYILLGSALGSFFLTTGLLSLWARDRRNQELLLINNGNLNNNRKVLVNSVKSLKSTLK